MLLLLPKGAESATPVLKIDELDIITNDVIEAAQSTLVIGVT